MCRDCRVSQCVLLYVYRDCMCAVTAYASYCTPLVDRLLQMCASLCALCHRRFYLAAHTRRMCALYRRRLFWAAHTRGIMRCIAGALSGQHTHEGCVRYGVCILLHASSARALFRCASVCAGPRDPYPNPLNSLIRLRLLKPQSLHPSLAACS